MMMNWAFLVCSCTREGNKRLVFNLKSVKAIIESARNLWLFLKDRILFHCKKIKITKNKTLPSNWCCDKNTMSSTPRILVCGNLKWEKGGIYKTMSWTWLSSSVASAQPPMSKQAYNAAISFALNFTETKKRTKQATKTSCYFFCIALSTCQWLFRLPAASRPVPAGYSGTVWCHFLP